MEQENVIKSFKLEGNLVKKDAQGGFTYAKHMTEVQSNNLRIPYEILLVSQDETMVLARKMRVLPEHENLQMGHQRWKFETCDKYKFELLKKIGDGWFWQKKSDDSDKKEYIQAHILFDRLEYLNTRLTK